jgi:RNA polymerase sigma factor (sigma-70 family)
MLQESPALMADQTADAGQYLADLSDSELLDRFVRSREERAFAVLMERHGPMVLGVCRRILHAPQDVEDAFQGTFLVLVRKAAEIGQRELLGNWLYGVAYRIAVRARANAAKRRAHERQAVAMAAADSLQEVVWRDLRPVLDDEVNQLPEKYRVPIVLCYLEGRTLEETARHLGCPKGTVATRLSRARERLRRRLGRRGVVVPLIIFTSVLTEKTAPAAVPATLTASTTQAALRYAAAKYTLISSTAEPLDAASHGLFRHFRWFGTRAGLASVLALLMVLFAGWVIAEETVTYLQFMRKGAPSRGSMHRGKDAGARLPNAQPDDADCATPPELGKKAR